MPGKDSMFNQGQMQTGKANPNLGRLLGEIIAEEHWLIYEPKCDYCGKSIFGHELEQKACDSCWEEQERRVNGGQNLSTPIVTP